MNTAHLGQVPEGLNVWLVKKRIPRIRLLFKQGHLTAKQVGIA